MMAGVVRRDGLRERLVAAESRIAALEAELASTKTALGFANESVAKMRGLLRDARSGWCGGCHHPLSLGHLTDCPGDPVARALVGDETPGTGDGA